MTLGEVQSAVAAKKTIDRSLIKTPRCLLWLTSAWIFVVGCLPRHCLLALMCSLWRIWRICWAGRALPNRRAEGFDKTDARMTAALVVHHTGMLRNKRCLMAYM